MSSAINERTPQIQQVCSIWPKSSALVQAVPVWCRTRVALHGTGTTLDIAKEMAHCRSQSAAWHWSCTIPLVGAGLTAPCCNWGNERHNTECRPCLPGPISPSREAPSSTTPLKVTLTLPNINYIHNNQDWFDFWVHRLWARRCHLFWEGVSSAVACLHPHSDVEQGPALSQPVSMNIGKI